ncbi:MAG: SH3 domain-containing protein, partial [Candidatus Sulfotelmatobacter sp.]
AEARSGIDDAELRQVRDAFAATQATLAEREQDLVKASTAIEAAHQRELERIEAARSKAEATWRANEAERLAAAERQWRGEHGKHLAEAKARYEAAELALADMRIKSRQEGAATEKLSNELAVLQYILNSRDIELARMRTTFEPDHQDISDLIKGQPRAAAELDDEQQVIQSERSLVRDAVVVMGVVMTFFLIYFRVDAFLPEYLRIAQPTIATENSVPAVGSAAPQKPAPALASSMEHDTAIVTRGVNLRAGPSTAADVIAALPRGVAVEKIEQRGNWTRVQTRGKRDPSKPLQGWMYNSYISMTGMRPEK